MYKSPACANGQIPLFGTVTLVRSFYKISPKSHENRVTFGAYPLEKIDAKNNYAVTHQTQQQEKRCLLGKEPYGSSHTALAPAFWSPHFRVSQNSFDSTNKPQSRLRNNKYAYAALCSSFTLLNGVPVYSLLLRKANLSKLTRPSAEQA